MKQLFSLIVILFCIQISFAKEGKMNWGKNVYYFGNIEAKKPCGTGTLCFLEQNTKIKDNKFILELSGEFRNDTIYSTRLSIEKKSRIEETFTFEGDVFYSINFDKKYKTTNVLINLVRGTISIDTRDNRKVKNYHISPSSKKGELKIDYKDGYSYHDPYPMLLVNLDGKCDELIIDGLCLSDFMIEGTYNNNKKNIDNFLFIHSAYNASINLSFYMSRLKKLETRNGFTSEFYNGAHGGGSSNLTRCRSIQASSFSATNKGEAEGTDVVYKDGKYTGTFTVPSWKPIDVLTKSEEILNSMQIIELKNGKYRYGEFNDTIKNGVNISEKRRNDERMRIEKEQKERQEGIAAFNSFFPTHQISSNAPSIDELAKPLFSEYLLPDFSIVINKEGYIWLRYRYSYKRNYPTILYIKFESGEIIELKSTHEIRVRRKDSFYGYWEDTNDFEVFYNLSPNLWKKLMFEKPIKIREVFGANNYDNTVKENAFIHSWYDLYKIWDIDHQRKTNPLSGF